MEHFRSIKKYHDYLNWPEVIHDKYSIVELAEISDCTPRSTSPFTTDFYTIMYQYAVKGGQNYGRTKYDLSNGTILFANPGRTLQWKNTKINSKGYIINIHKKLLKDYGMEEKIKSYQFFGYNSDEALHPSKREENTLRTMIENIVIEYENADKDFNPELMLSYIESFLIYVKRCYERQFLHRSELNKKIIGRLKREFIADTQGKGIEEMKVVLESIAEEMGVSLGYLDTMLQLEQKKTIEEYVNEYLLEMAREKLLQSADTIAKISEELGFKNPNKFTLFFKEKMKVTPSAYRKKMKR